MGSNALVRGLAVAALLVTCVYAGHALIERNTAVNGDATSTSTSNVASIQSTASATVDTETSNVSTPSPSASAPTTQSVTAGGSSAETTLDESIDTVFETEGEPLSKQLANAFSDVRPEQTPSGILLERGGVQYVDVIHRADGVGQVPALTQREFNNAVSELYRGQDPSIPEDGRLSSPEDLRQEANQWVQTRNTIPVSVAIIAYDTLGDEAETLRFDDNGKAILPVDEPIGETRIFVAATPQVPKIPRWVNQFVLPSSLLVSTGVTRDNIRGVVVQTPGGITQRVEFDQPFSIGSDASVLPADGNELTLGFEIELTGNQTLRAESVTAVVDAPDMSQRRAPLAAASVAASERDVGTADLYRECIPGIECYDMAPVLATIPYRGGLGGINVRIYPATGSVTENADGQLSAVLHKPLVAVDGFDLNNTNTQDDFWVRFGSESAFSASSISDSTSSQSTT